MNWKQQAEKYAAQELISTYAGKLTGEEVKHIAKVIVEDWEPSKRVMLPEHVATSLRIASHCGFEIFKRQYLSNFKNLEVKVGMFLTHCKRPEQVYDVMYETEGKINGEWVKGFTYGYVHKATGKWKTYWRAANNFDSDWKEFKTEDKQELFRI